MQNKEINFKNSFCALFGSKGFVSLVPYWIPSFDACFWVSRIRLYPLPISTDGDSDNWKTHAKLAI